MYCLECGECHLVELPPGAILKLALCKLVEGEFVGLGDWKSLYFDSLCVQPHHWFKRNDKELRDRFTRCRDVIFASSEPGEPIPERCGRHNPPCELRCFMASVSDESQTTKVCRLVLLHSPTLTSPYISRSYPVTCGVDRCQHQHTVVLLVRSVGVANDAFTTWLLACARTRRHVAQFYKSSLPSQQIHYSDTLAVYGFETEKPHGAIPQDVIDCLRNIEDTVHALPEKTSTPYKLVASSPYLHSLLRGFDAWEMGVLWPRLPNPLLMFLSQSRLQLVPKSGNTSLHFVQDRTRRGSRGEF